MRRTPALLLLLLLAVAVVVVAGCDADVATGPGWRTGADAPTAGTEVAAARIGAIGGPQPGLSSSGVVESLRVGTG